jgi:uncharacterized damage-inducible protein DinB
MNTSATALKSQFDLHTRLFNNVLDSVDDTDANAQNDERINHIKWVAGHLLNMRVSSLTRLTGGQPDESYVAQFARGTALEPGAVYPPISAITGKWNETAARISEGFTHIPEEALSATTPAKSPIADDTMRGLFAFLMSHEAYHIGQLSILRKLAGKEAMSYN